MKDFGQVSVTSEKYKTDTEADEAASLACKRKEATEYQYKVTQEKKREENIGRIKANTVAFGNYCKAHKIELKQKATDAMYNGAVLVLDKIIGWYSFGFGKIKAKVSRNAKGSLVFDFSYADSKKTEL